MPFSSRVSFGASERNVGTNRETLSILIGVWPGATGSICVPGSACLTGEIWCVTVETNRETLSLLDGLKAFLNAHTHLALVTSFYTNDDDAPLEPLELLQQSKTTSPAATAAAADKNLLEKDKHGTSSERDASGLTRRRPKRGCCSGNFFRLELFPPRPTP